MKVLRPLLLGSCMGPEKVAAAWAALSAAAARKQALSRRVGWECRRWTRVLGLAVRPPAAAQIPARCDLCVADRPGRGGQAGQHLRLEFGVLHTFHLQQRLHERKPVTDMTTMS